MKNIPIRHIQAPRKESDFSDSFSIRDIGDLLLRKDMVQELHRHDFVYILALEKGSGNHEIDFVSYTICDYSVFVMRPGQVHQLMLKTGSTGYLIEFNMDFYITHNTLLTRQLRKASNLNFYIMDIYKFEKLFSVLRSVFQEYTMKQEGYREVIKANLDILFIELIRQHGKNSSIHANHYLQERFDEFSELLEMHISTHKQVIQYANLMNISPYQLNSIVKTTSGKTCSELINEYIILEAKRYLLATSNQVNQIADHLGYDDISYFIRFFRKHTGYSPEAFRRNFR